MKQKVHGAQKGFTLIELLIVITIIGILAAALLPNVFGATAKARDAARMTAINQIAQALESFNSDYAHYPSDIYTKAGGDDGEKFLKYFPGQTIPVNPNGINGGKYGYCTASTGTFSYIIGSPLESTSNQANGDKSKVTALSTTCAEPKPDPGTTPDAFYLAR